MIPIALITGGSSGIGRSIAYELGRRGIRVYTASRSLADFFDDPDNDKTTPERWMRTVRLDVHSPDQGKRVVEKIVAERVGLISWFRRPDSASPGRSRTQPMRRPAAKWKRTFWFDQFAAGCSGTNAKAAFRPGCQYRFGRRFPADSVSSILLGQQGCSGRPDSGSGRRSSSIRYTLHDRSAGRYSNRIYKGQNRVTARIAI